MAMGMQGWRRTMEDSHIAHTDLDNGVSLFGVFDGHGGELNIKQVYNKVLTFIKDKK